jgi:hypothetical protein
MNQESKTLTLSERLLRYSAAASLATTGTLMVGSTQVRADGISRDVNCVMNSVEAFCDIDFDDDGLPEFSLSMGYSYLWMWPYSTYSTADDLGLSFVFDGSLYYAAVLPFGAPISSGRADWTNSYRAVLWSSYYGSSYGNWGAPKGHETDARQGDYLGVSFQLDGNSTHYGWIELYIPENGNVTVKRIGYDNTAGASIPAALELQDLKAFSGFRAAAASAFATLAGIFTWARRKIAGE